MLNLTQIQAIRDVVSLPIDVFMRANRIDLLEQCHAPRGDVTALESLRQFEARLHDEPEALRRHAIMLREIFLGVNPIQYGRRAAGTPLRLDAVGPAPDWDEVANEIEQFIDLHKEIKQQYDDMMREGIDQERRHSIIELTRVRGASLTAPQITNLISSLSIMCDGILESDIDSDIVERCISENSSLGLSVAAIRDSVAGDNTLTYIDGQPYSFEQIFINANFRGVPEEIAEDWRSFIYFIQGRPNDFSEEVCLRLGQYPNYNPYLFAELIRFNQELPPLVSASTRAYLLQLREAYLGQSFLNSTFEGFEDRDEARRNIEIERGVITDSEFDQIELEVTRYFYRVGTLPFSLERLGHDEVDQAVIQGIITEYVMDRLQAHRDTRDVVLGIRQECDTRTREYVEGIRQRERELARVRQDFEGLRLQSTSEADKLKGVIDTREQELHSFRENYAVLVTHRDMLDRRAQELQHGIFGRERRLQELQKEVGAARDQIDVMQRNLLGRFSEKLLTVKQLLEENMVDIKWELYSTQKRGDTIRAMVDSSQEKELLKLRQYCQFSKRSLKKSMDASEYILGEEGIDLESLRTHFAIKLRLKLIY